MNNETLIANVLATMTQGNVLQPTSNNLLMGTDVAKLTALSEDQDCEVISSKRRTSKKTKRIEHPLATVVQVVNKPRESMNHSYNDFSSVPADMNYLMPEKIEDMTFAQKVHHFLSQDRYLKWVSWLPHGRSFKVHIPAVFEREVLVKYFGHKRYSSFLRQLNNHGFKHITKGVDRNSYYHECMLRGMPHLCKFMPEPRDARRLLADPDNEPDFYQISRNFPLPDVKTANFDLSGTISAGQNVSGQPSLHSRCISDMNWLMEQMPASKRMRTMSDLPCNVSLGMQQLSSDSQQMMSQLQAQLQAAAAAVAQQGTPAPADPLLGLRMGTPSSLNTNAFAALLANHQNNNQRSPNSVTSNPGQSQSQGMNVNNMPDALAALLLGSQQHYGTKQS